MTTVLTATVLGVSLLPWLVKEVVGSITFSRIANSFAFLNTMCNFYIYCLAVASFRHFVWSRFQMLSRRLVHSTVRGSKL